MRRTSILIGIMAVAAMVISLYAQNDMIPAMKEMQPTFGSLNKNIAGGMAADAAKDAEKLQGLFKATADFMKAQKQDKAVGWANDAAAQAGEVAKAIKANDMATAGTTAKAIQKACKNCHDVHRDGTPGAFKYKAP